MALPISPAALARLTASALLTAALLGFPFQATAQQPLTTAFTYQGELASAGTPASGTYDLRFRLFDAPSGGNQIGPTLCSDNLAVTAGRFAASLDFGAAALSGQQRFLEIEVRSDSGLDCSDATGYTVLTPRQELTATPNATFAQTAASATSATTATTALTATNATSLNGQPASFFTNAANLTGTLPAAALSGTYSAPLTLSNPANSFTGNGAAITNLSATNVSTGVLANARTTGTNLNTASTLVLRDPSGGFAAGTITAALNGTATNATQLGGQPASFYTNASNVSTGTLANARTTGTNLNTVNTLVLRDSSGNFSAGTITAALNGNAATATNATQLSGQPASFYSNASNITAGTLADARLSPNVLLLSSPGASQFAGSLGIGLAPGINTRFQVLGGYDAPVVDQSQLTLSGAAGSADQWQSFTAGLTGRLSGVRLGVGSPLSGTSSPGTIQIYEGEGTGGQLLATQQVTYAPVAPNQVQQFDFVSPPSIAAGAVYTIRFSAPSVNVGWVRLNSANSYPGGRYSSAAGSDAVFATLVALPQPALSVSGSGVSIGAAAAPPASNGLSVAGPSVFAAGVTAQSFSGAGTGLTNLNASNITSGTLANAQTTGTAANAPSTLVLRDASGNFFAGTITASLNGNASSATSATNATQLNGQPASFYTHASNITTGTLANGQTTGTAANTPSTLVLRDSAGNFAAGTITANLNGNANSATTANRVTGTVTSTALPVREWSPGTGTLVINSISTSAGTYGEINGTRAVVALRQGVAVINWTTTGYATAVGSLWSLRVRAAEWTGGPTSVGNPAIFYFNQAGVHTTISGNTVISVPATGTYYLSLEVSRVSGAGAYLTDTNDGFSATIINLGQ